MHTFAVIAGQLRIQKVLYANKDETHFFIDAVKSRQVASKGRGVLRGNSFYRSQSIFNGVNALVLRIVGGLCLFDVLVDDVQHLVDKAGIVVFRTKVCANALNFVWAGLTSVQKRGGVRFYGKYLDLRVLLF